MNNWVEVSQKEVNKIFKKPVNGSEVKMMTSPFNTPVAFRMGVDEVDDFFYIDFKYLSNTEPKETIQRKKGFVLQVGKNTQKIYRIQIANVYFESKGESLDLHMGLIEAHKNVQHSCNDYKDVGNESAISNLLIAQKQNNSQSLRSRVN